MEKLRVLNVDVCDLTMDYLVNEITHGVVLSLNVDIAIKLQKDKEYHKLLNSDKNNVILCMDSQVIRLLYRLLFGVTFVERVSGSDYLPIFCEKHHESETKVFLLGAQENVAYSAMNSINSKIGSEVVVGACSPSFGFENNREECSKIIADINRSGANVLAVGLGAPKQEKWIFKYKNDLPSIKLYMGVGAAIDFAAGNVKRAPQWMSNMGVEWLYRLIKEPKRLYKRYLYDDVPFIWLLVKQRLGLYKSPFG